MNKYMGFYEMRNISLPTVPWRLFTKDTELDGGLLWTVRVAVENSGDLSLPRIVGAGAADAMSAGRRLLDAYEGKGIVIYYPYFIAQKSGVMEIDSGKTIIEAVEKDLWNLVTYGHKNVTCIIPFGESGGNGRQYIGDREFLTDAEIEELLGYGSILRGRFRREISGGSSILAEWSYAFSTDIRHEPIGGRYLVFYELRQL